MKQGARRWVVGLLAGGALAAAGCRGGEGNERDREGHAFETPQHRASQPQERDAAEPRGAATEHPSVQDQESPAGQLPRGAQMGGGTAGPINTERGESAGGLPHSVPAGLGTSLAEAYKVSAPGGDTATGGSGSQGAPTAPGGDAATGGSGSQGAPTAPGGAAGGSGTSGLETSGGAGSSGGGHGGQQGRK